MKIKKRNKKELILLIVVLQIFLLINFVISQSYIIHESKNFINANIKSNSKKDFFKKGVNFLFGFFSIKEIGIVSAQQGIWCCEEINGATCQDIYPESQDDCEGEIWATRCDSTALCKTGTCIDEEGGTCAIGTKKECGDNWKDEEITKVDECEYGCCTLDGGASKEFMRNIKCKAEEGNFDPSVEERDCRIYTQDMGACLLGEGNCKFTTEEECEKNLNGNFRRGVLCSNPDLDTICEKPATKEEIRTGCYEDRVYFLDSCGNIANVYNSAKWNNVDYWSFVRDSECGDNKGNINSKSCGECGGIYSFCSSASEEGVNPDYGDYTCKDLSCVDEDGNKRENTESWCVYEGYVGDSLDVVGSEHRIRWCDRGEIKTDLCGNYRTKICGERELEIGNGDIISIARCRTNEASKCFELEPVPYDLSEKGKIKNQEEIDEYIEECESYSDCRTITVDLHEEDGGEAFKKKVKEYFVFSVCVPEYPIGLEFWEMKGNSKSICDAGSIEVPVVEKKKLIGGWTCEANCEVLEYEFVKKMNDYCISLGDCGGYVNIKGEYTKNFRVQEGYNKDIQSGKKSEYEKNAETGEGDFPLYISSTEKAYLGGDPFDLIDFEAGEIGFDYNPYIALGGMGGLIGLAVGATYASIAEMGLVAALGPVGWGILIGAGVVVAFLYFVLGIGKTREITVEFQCKPWSAPSGGEYCEECDDDPLRPCTEYKCRSLGTGCRLIDENELYESENSVCIYQYRGDDVPPQIKLNEIDEETYLVEEKENGIKIKRNDGECIQEFSKINFSLKTEDENGEDDYAKCYYNLERISATAPDYELEGEEFKEGGFFSVNHTFDQRLPRVSDLNSADISGNVKGEREGNLNLYVRCIDYAGNPTFKEYAVNLCLKEGPDNEIAQIDEYFPEDESFLQFGETNVSTIIKLDEPAECKWSHKKGILYKNMEEEMSCSYSINHPELGGKCVGEFTELTESENKIYIKCKDQPWISETDYDGHWKESDRNVNEMDFIYILYSTENNLEISSITPQGKVIRGVDEFEIMLNVDTKGGVENGVSKCKYKIIESPLEISSRDFFIQEDTHHEYPFNFPFGEYNISISCEDNAGNSAKGNAVFELVVDRKGPTIVRAYKDNGQLKLKTDELAKCYYSLESCFYSFEDENIFDITSAFYTEHSTEWNPEETYYIKCEDTFGNINSGCAIKIVAS